MSVWFREKIQALLWWRDNSMRVKLRLVLPQAPVRWTRRFWTAMRPYSADAVYVNALGATLHEYSMLIRRC